MFTLLRTLAKTTYAGVGFITRRHRCKASGVTSGVGGLRVLLRTLPLFSPHRWKMAFAGLSVLFVSGAVAVMPLFTKKVIDEAIPKKDLHLTVMIMAAFVVLMFLRMTVWYAGQCVLMYVREQAVFRLRSSLFSKMQELGLRFHHRYSPGYLYDRTMGTASSSIYTFIATLFNTVLMYICSGLISLVICIRMNAAMTLWILAISVVYAAASKYYSRRMQTIMSEYNLRFNEFAGLLTDLLRGVKTIKAFTMEERVSNKFDERLWPLQMRYLDINKESMRLSFITEALGYLITAFVVIAGARLVIGQNMELGTLVAFMAYQASLINMMSYFSSLAIGYGTAVAGLQQIYEVLDEKPSVVERPDAAMPEVLRGHITLCDLHFAYEDNPVIKGVDVSVPPGQSVALVGPSGCGKTTLINLLLRLYDPNHGCIRLDDRDIRDLPLQQYRGLFGVVLQDPFLFNDTIYNNLAAVKPDATEADVRNALELSQAWEFVCQLEGGWHFKVGESGGLLSGGQKQRIALARCILTDPRVMILDEATSALDNQSEMLVQEALQDVMQGRTTFIIAHRLSTVRNVDRILVLHDGQIVQDGRFDELSRTPGLFRDLHMASFCIPMPEDTLQG